MEPLFALSRGPGFYFHPLKLGGVLAVYLIWVKVCWWVNRDCREHSLPGAVWNPSQLIGGLLGIAMVFTLPVFEIAFPVLLLLSLSPSLVYVVYRNPKVDDEQKVLTLRHFQRLLSGKSRAVDKGPGRFIPVRFIGKSGGGKDEDATRVRRAEESSGYRLAIEMVHDAIQKRATDIHMEPTQDEMTVRFRIDGILQPGTPMPRDQGDGVLNIFKVLADLDITEKRKAQDGSFSAEVQAIVETLGNKRRPKKKQNDDDDEPLGMTEEKPKMITRQIDFRVATAGSVIGEKLVMRILDRSKQVTDLAQLGMKLKLSDQIRGVVTQPHGLFIVCGPTGSGKSTTLCACLFQLDRNQKNIITVENPVEYHIDGVTQIEVNPKAGKTFASELRSILRQDPDVIYIGEVRDKETAEIACQAAQTGHMVFTTLHANDTVTAIGRLLELDVKPFVIASSLTAVLGQRLVRLLCPKCKVAYRPNPELLRRMNLPADKIKQFYRARREEERTAPCENCNDTGYRGRTGVFELLVINDRFRELIKADPSPEALKQEALKGGMIMLLQDGIRVVISGETSIDEIQRVAK
ncbi:MAG: type II/IV secretion system protein [Planctomycetia bacterium]|nr:type II/IV secretion system protein [Planctomycetia bacterium]